MKPILYYPDYHISETVKVYSMKYGHRKTLKQCINSHGYRVVTLYRNGAKHTYTVARLMLETFVSACPFGMEVCHGPKGKLDDSLENLCWGTPSKNMGEDKLRDGADQRGEKNGRSKLTQKQVLKIRSLEGRMLLREIATIFNIHLATVSRIIRHQLWKGA